jgi:outer membrane protein
MNMIMQRRILSIAAVLFLLLQHSATAQNQHADSLISEVSSGPAVTYSIQQCIDSALTNNPVVKSAEIVELQARITRLQYVGIALPTLSGYGSYGRSNGHSVNYNTGTYVDADYNQGYGQLQGYLNLWNAGSILNFIRGYSTLYEATKKDWQYQKDLITINVILAYLQVLSAEEQLDLAQTQAADIRHKTDLMAIQDSVGAIAPSDYSDMKGQLASSEYTIVQAKNLVENNKLSLAQLMNVPYSPNMDLVKLNTDPNPVLYDAPVDQVYQKATQNIASIAAAQLHVDAAKRIVKASRENLAPTLQFYYGLQSQYTQAATTNSLLSTSYVNSGSYVTVNGTQVPVYSPQGNYSNSKIVALNDQLKDNKETQYGLQLQIPILGQLTKRTLLLNNKVALEQAQFNQKTILSTLRQSVESNYVQMMQAFRAYNVLYREVRNYEESFRQAQIKYDNGVLGSLAFVIYNTNKNNAELALIGAKYSYLLQTKILDYFQGQLTW